MALALGVSLSTGTVSCSGPPPLSVSCPGCNVVLVSMDTLRSDFVGAYGQKRPTTPNIDSLAAGGALFENAVSQSSWTRPAHMSMFTGLYPIEHGYTALVDRQRLPESVTTLARVFAEHGYTTAAFTGGVNLDAAFGFDQGFDSYRSNGKYFRDNLEETKFWLEGHKGRQFFLFWHGYDAHTPYVTDPIDRAALGLKDRAPRRSLRRVCTHGDGSRAGIRNYLDEYAAAVHRGDRYLGKLLSYLRQLGLREKTVILFTADHGEEFLEHGGCFHLSTLYQEVLRVPFIVVSPGVAPRRIKALIPASVSVGATLLELVGIPRGELPGNSLARAVLTGKLAPVPVVSETRRRLDRRRGKGHLRSIQSETGKLIDWITLGRTAFFDLEHDPKELSAIADGKRHDALRAELERWVVRHPPRDFVVRTSSPLGPKRQESPEQRERTKRLEREMRSLGYLD